MTIADDVAKNHLLRFQRVAGPAKGGLAALAPLSFTLDPGARAWLAGPAGSGKSRALDLVAATAPPPSGRIFLFGDDIAGWTRSERTLARRRLGLVFEGLRLADELSAFDNLALAARAVGRRREEYVLQVAELLAWVGLGRRREQRAADLNPEGRCRLALARALINGPELLLIDDLGKDLSPPARLLLLKLIDGLHEAGIAVLMAVGLEALGDDADAPIIRLAGARPDGQ